MPEREKKRASSAQDQGALILKVLGSLAQSAFPLSTDDLARETDATSSAVTRALKVLVTESFATFDAMSGHYVLGPKFIRIAHQAQSRYPIDVLRPILRRLVDTIGETVTLNTYTAPSADCVCILVEESPAPLHYVVEVGDRKPLHAGSSGKAILAHLTDEEIRSYIQTTGLPQVTSRTTNDPEKLWRELRRIRADGIAVSKGQRLKGAVAVGGSVFGVNGRIHASVVATIPEQRYKIIERDLVIHAVKSASIELSSVFADWNIQ